MRHYIDTLDAFFSRLASDRIPFSYVVLTFFAAVILRTFAEHVVLSFGFSPEWGEDLAHYTLSYIALALTLILFLNAWTGDTIMRAARIVLPGFIILNIVPVIDRALGVQGAYCIAYFLPDQINDLGRRFLTFFGSFEKLGVTPGMRMEIALVMIVTGLYIFSRTRRVAWSVLGGFFFYVLIFAYIAMPFWVKGAMAFLGVPAELDSWLFIRWYLVLVCVLGVVTLYCANRKVFISVLADIRFFRLCHYLLLIVLGGAAHARNMMLPMPVDREAVFRGCFLVISVSSAWLFSVITNNLADQAIDRISNPGRPSVTGAVDSGLYRCIGWGSLCCAVFFAFMSGIKEFEIILVFLGSYFLYSMPPLRLKRVPVLSKCVIGMNSLLMFMLGYIFFVKWATMPPMVVVFFLVFMSMAANFIDLKDYEGDRQAGVRTLPVLVGFPLAQKFVGIFFVLTYLAAYAAFHLTYAFWLCVGAGILQYMLINRKNYDERPVFVVHLLSLMFITAYLVFSPR